MSERERKYRVALVALEECNKIHGITGWEKIPLQDVADTLDITKEEIVEGFNLLVEEGVIGDDGDYDHMNYSDVGDLIEIVMALLAQLEKEKEREEEIVQYIE